MVACTKGCEQYLPRGSAAAGAQVRRRQPVRMPLLPALVWRVLPLAMQWCQEAHLAPQAAMYHIAHLQ